VGTLEPRKNLQRVEEATRLAGLELRVVGPPGWGGVSSASWLGAVSDEELASLYRGAACAAYVSLYEGFGLPVLEAMACGTAAVAPDRPPFSEFAAGVAVGVDPLEPKSIAAGLREAIARRDELGPLGATRAARYEWRRVARDHMRIYREAAL
jgi:glycosyltransferase involved in cell wall biosynthesis